MYARTAWALGLLLVTWNTTQHARAYEIDRKQNRVVLSSIADFSRCQDQAGFSDLCLEGLKDYVKTHPSERLAAGKAVRLRFNHWVALHFFAGALDKASPEQCADEDVSMAVVSGLALPSDHPNLTLAQKIVDGRCGAALQAPVKQALKDGGGHYQDHACPWLKKQNVDAPECAPQPQVKATPTPPRAAKLGSLNAHALPTDPQSALAFRGEENEQLLLVRARAPHDDVVLLKWKGLRGPWNNQIIAAVEVVHGRDKEYVASVDGKDYVVMTLDGGSYEAYPKGYQASLRLYRQVLASQARAPEASEIAKELAPPPPPAAAKK